MSRTLRLFQPGDSAAVADLCRRSVVDARIPLSVDRSPDFSLLDELQSDRWDIILVEEDQRLIAFADLVHVDLPYRNQSIPATYGRLGGIHPDYQGKGVFRNLVMKTYEVMAERGTRMFFGLVNQKNEKMKRAIASRTVQDPWLLNHRLEIHSVLPVSRCRPVGEYRYRKATAEDTPALAGLLSGHNQRYLFGPPVTADDLAGTVDKYPDFSIDDILVAEDRRGLPVACAGFWDQSRARKVRVASYRLLETMLRPAWNLFARTTGLRPMPRPGGLLQMLFATLVAAKSDHQDALAGLWRQASSRLLCRNYHFLLVACFSHDPLNRTLQGIRRLTSVNRFVVTTPDPDVFQILQDETAAIPYLDYALS